MAHELLWTVRFVVACGNLVDRQIILLVLEPHSLEQISDLFLALSLMVRDRSLRGDALRNGRRLVRQTQVAVASVIHQTAQPLLLNFLFAAVLDHPLLVGQVHGLRAEVFIVRQVVYLGVEISVVVIVYNFFVFARALLEPAPAILRFLLEFKA